MSGVGISFGADRIYDVLKGLGKFPESLSSSTDILFANMDSSALPYILPIAKSLRESGVACEIYPETSKLKKQFDYADKRSIGFISIIGENEIDKGVLNVKNLSSGEQRSFAKDDMEGIISFISNAQN